MQERQLWRPKLRPRRGSIIVIVMYGTLMAMVMLMMMQLASTLYTSSKESAKVYPNIQTYRAATELACYQYITDLESVVVTKNLDTDWLSVSDNAVVTQALQAIQDAIADTNDKTLWKVDDVTQALQAANISDPSVLTTMLAKLTNVRQEFSLKVPEPIKVDWDDEKSWRNQGDMHGVIEPVTIEVSLQVRGESTFETFLVSGLYLDVQADEPTPGTFILTMAIAEEIEGVTINRAV